MREQKRLEVDEKQKADGELRKRNKIGKKAVASRKKKESVMEIIVLF